MSHTLNLVLRCDHRTPTDDGKTRQCLKIHLGRPHAHIGDVRDAAVQAGWTFKPGQPQRHIGAHDYCPEHAQ